MAAQYPQYQYGAQQSAYRQDPPLPPAAMKPQLPRSISTTNLETTRQCQDLVQQDLCTSVPPGGTYFFMNLPMYTFTIPHLNSYPPDFRQFVFERIVDKTAKKSLEEEKCLNWCMQATKLEPLHTNGDGNCLLHAASLGMWGFQDRANILRNAVSQAVAHASNTNTLFDRWRHNKTMECRQQGYELEPRQWQQEWQTVVRQASSDLTATSTLYSLEEFHVFVLANVLRRPVIMYASQKMRSIQTGGTMQCINFHGLYLPLLWDPKSCKKDPLPLAYQNGHFSALVVVDFAQQYRDGQLVLPLVSCDNQPLPVRFTLHSENQESLLNDYLSIITITGSNSPYPQMRISCASLSINLKPAYYDRLVTGFIEACHDAYLQQQQQQQSPYSQGMGGTVTGTGGGYPTGYQGGSGMVGRDGRYAPTAGTAAVPVESSYTVVTKPEDPYAPGAKGSEGHLNKVKCINNCGMYGDPETAGLCSKCYGKSLDAARQLERPREPPRPNTGDSGFNSTSSLTASGSIKCPNCSQPGHPNFLGMCERCYSGTQVGGQQQPKPQPSTQPQYGNQLTPPQYGNKPAQPQYGNQPAQPEYGNQAPQPFYGNQGPQQQPLYGNKQQNNAYESLDQYQKNAPPPPQPQGAKDDPPPVPPPRSTASTLDKNKCRTPSCNFFGTAETRYYCSQCFETKMDAILKEVDTPPPRADHHLLSQATPYGQQGGMGAGPGPMMYETPAATQHASPTKCHRCQEYFGAVEYGGLCHGCFKNKTKEDANPSKCPGCIDFFGSEEYGGFCHNCFLKKTEQETRAPNRTFDAPPPASQSSIQDMSLPAPAFDFGNGSTVPPVPSRSPEQQPQTQRSDYTHATQAPLQSHHQQYPQPVTTYSSSSQAGYQPAGTYMPSSQAGYQPAVTYAPSSQAGYQPAATYVHSSQAGYQPAATYAPSSQAGYQPAATYAPSSQAGYQQPYTRPAENRQRPIPKPRTRTAMKPAQQYSMIDPQMHMRTAPVVTTANLTHAMAAMSIASNPTTATGGNCFICSGTSPEITGSYFVCQQHAQLMTKQLTALPPAASQADVSRPPQQYQQPNPSIPAGGHPLPPTHGGPLQQPGPSGYPAPQPTVPPRDEVRQQPSYPLTPNIHGANYSSVLPSTQLPSAGQYSTAAMRNPHPQDIRTPYSEAGYMAGGGNPPYNPPPAAGGGVTPPYNPQPAAGGGVTPPYNPPPAAGGGVTRSYNPQPATGGGVTRSYNPQPATGGGVTPPYNLQPATGGGVTPPYNPPPAAGGGNMLNNLDTNVTGTGISARSEEFSAVGSGVHSVHGGATAQGYGATGGYGGAIGGGAAPGIIGGIAGSGVIVGGGGSAGAGFIQAGVSNPTNPPAPRKKVLCKTAGCSFYAIEKLENFCSDCYEDYYGMKPPDEIAP